MSSTAAVLGTSLSKRAATLAVVVAALGYFVDIYDLILFGMVRKPSLIGLGICRELSDLACGTAVTESGIFLFNMQMGGMLLGGILWGVLGDKRGRLSVLFGSIAMYSIANVANGLVDSVSWYAVCRFIAGVGLAGELGAGITLVSELMDRTRRGLGTTLVAALGVLGGLMAGVIGGAFPSIPHPDWRMAYFIGGGMGLVLLVMRVSVLESGLFTATSKAGVDRGNLAAFFVRPKRLTRYLAIIAVGIPVWFIIGIGFQFSDVLGGAMGLAPAPSPARALFFCYCGTAVGGLGCGLLSQAWHSRKKALGAFIALSSIVMVLYFTVGSSSLTAFYWLCFLGGCAAGYWSVFIATAAELFGTNLRATVTTTAPNFVRGSAVILTIGFKTLAPSVGWVGSAQIVGVISLVISLVGLFLLPETFGIDLDFHET